MRKRPRNVGYHWDVAEMVRRPDGGRSCRMCKGPVAPPKRNWCADPACLEEWLFRTRPAVLRSAVYARDGGRCRACGLDLSLLDLTRLVWNLYLADLALADRNSRVRAGAAAAVAGLDGNPVSRGQWLAWIGSASDWRARHRLPPRRSAWEVDHITPVSQGGDYFARANLQLLCAPCHRLKTAAGNRKPSG
jgi:5-methylcytosine-specific restriction endonuclease McrA